MKPFVKFSIFWTQFIFFFEIAFANKEENAFVLCISRWPGRLYLKRHKRWMKCISEALFVIFYWLGQRERVKGSLIQRSIMRAEKGATRGKGRREPLEERKAWIMGLYSFSILNSLTAARNPNYQKPRRRQHFNLEWEEKNYPKSRKRP